MNSNDAKPVRYLTAADISNINYEIMGGDSFPRDFHLLNSAVARPAMWLFGQEQFPTIIDKAASLLHSLAYHHLFVDGNKRTALKAVEQFLELNGYELIWSEQEEYDFILEVAQGRFDVAEVALQLTPYVQEKQL